MGTDKVIFVAEQWGATGSDVTGSYVTGSRVPGSMQYACATGSFPIHPSGAFSSEVTSVTGSDRVRMRNRYILFYYQSSSTSTMATCNRRGGRVCACSAGSCAISPQWGLFTGSWLQEVTSFSRAFFLVVVHNGGWGVLYDVRVYSFPWLSAPFIFIITYKVCCFQICCVVLQGSYL